jgi:DNA-binding transcriptional regulator YhcF (GntR family)
MDISAITADSSVQRTGTGKETMDPINFDGAGLPQRISQALIKAILDRTLRGGDRLVETELQKHFGVSRSPLREAFRDLEKRGLVEIRARRGTFVKKITRKDINEHYPVLAVLEGLAARQAHAHMNTAAEKRWPMNSGPWKRQPGTVMLSFSWSTTAASTTSISRPAGINCSST